MSSIYAISADGIAFQELDLPLSDLFSYMPEEMGLHELADFSQNNLGLSSWWPKMGVEFIPRPANPLGQIPDISLWDGATLVLSPKAYRYLGDSLADYGESLPVDVAGEIFYIFNCLRIAPEDEALTKFEYEGDIRLGLEQLAFKSEASENLVFKSVLQSCITVYCNGRFKEAVESFGLTGIVFESNLLPALYGNE